MKYEYYVNLNERGRFYADVRNPAGQTVWELSVEEDSLEDTMDGLYPLEHPQDVEGLLEHLKETGILNATDTLTIG